MRQVLEDHGFYLDRSHGSHYVFELQRGDMLKSLTIPRNKPHIKLVYVQRSLEVLEEIGLSEAEAGEDNEQ